MDMGISGRSGETPEAVFEQSSRADDDKLHLKMNTKSSKPSDCLLQQSESLNF